MLAVREGEATRSIMDFGYDYESCVKASEKVSWRLDDARHATRLLTQLLTGGAGSITSRPMRTER